MVMKTQVYAQQKSTTEEVVWSELEIGDWFIFKNENAPLIKIDDYTFYNARSSKMANLSDVFTSETKVTILHKVVISYML